jgi:hypothetical protein
MALAALVGGEGLKNGFANGSFFAIRQEQIDLGLRRILAGERRSRGVITRVWPAGDGY